MPMPKTARPFVEPAFTELVAGEAAPSRPLLEGHRKFIMACVAPVAAVLGALLGVDPTVMGEALAVLAAAITGQTLVDVAKSRKARP